ncbi:hypothetical protein SAMN05421772_105165 [Paracoccus saliphilus]|uniref:Uncharacterized protein n=1 Tax=Paracoccus saliphilus TaxID=405559 RepID=A0AA46A5I0_9RHOB|nr:hypothetical protein SAMN05421772_105165 [Paracoccus saliphilus]
MARRAGAKHECPRGRNALTGGDPRNVRGPEGQSFREFEKEICKNGPRVNEEGRALGR